jgi:hypothetical protein
MDNWLGHITGDMIGLFTEGRVCAIAFAPYTTQIFQVFDVAFFDIFKRHPRYELPFGDAEVSMKFLMQVYHGHKQRTISCNTDRTFQALRLEFDIGN